MLSERKLQELREQCPDSCLMRGDGTYVPKALISDAEMQRDALVKELFSLAEEAHQVLAELKKKSAAEVIAHVDLVTGEAVSEAEVAKRSNRLYSFDGALEVEYTLEPVYRVNERIVEVQQLVENAAAEVEGGKNLIKAVRDLSAGSKVQDQVIRWLDKSKVFEGSTSWLKAMQVLKECLVEVEKRPYIRFYEHVEGKRNLLVLNFSALPVD